MLQEVAGCGILHEGCISLQNASSVATSTSIEIHVFILGVAALQPKINALHAGCMQPALRSSFLENDAVNEHVHSRRRFQIVVF
jgi:hypothetical protein